jgi:hypothetical protein
MIAQEPPNNRDLDIFKNFVLPGVDAAGFSFGGQGPVEPPPPPAVVSQRYESPSGSALGTPGTTSRPPDLEDIVEGKRKPYVKKYPDLGQDPDMLEMLTPVKRHLHHLTNLKKSRFSPSGWTMKT